ncbi:MAG TPA: DUF5123 domain-containing protein [Paludibacter sp.]|nr:DUF5123 domain-containing protein [Paludibacter sp.]
MRNILKFNKFILYTAFISVFFIGCVDEEPLVQADRLFRPIMKKSIVSGNWLRFEWDRYKGAIGYELELSTDTFKTIERSDRTDSTAFTYSNLEFDTKYQIRLRSVGDSIVASGDTVRSEYNIIHLATIDYPTYLKTPESSDIIDKSIRVKWNVTSLVYTRFDIMVNKDSVYKSVEITPAENAAGEKIISGLMPTTTYFVKIYDENGYKGKKVVKTVSSQVFEGDVVDLRDFSDEVALNKLTQLYIDSLGTVYPNGFNLVLSGGTKYKVPTINIPVSVNIVTGLSFKGKAIMAVNGSIGIKAATTVPSIKLEKLFFTEGTDAGKLRTDGNFGGTYLFNLNQADGNVNNILIENCDVKYKRGSFRIQTTATVGLLTISNSVFDSIGGYGIVNLDNAGAMVTDLVLKNSTFAHYDGYLCRNTKSTGQPNSIKVENITTCYAPASGRYYFELTDRTYPGGIIIKNSIFGSVKDAATTVHGLRSASTNVSVENCFKTSDLVWTIAPGATVPTYPIETTDLGKTSAEIFADPTKGNFKVTLSSLVNKVGDPRWW